MSEVDTNFKQMLYCLDSAIECFNDRNYGDEAIWMSKVRRHWELYQEAHPKDYNPYENLVLE